MSSTQIGDVRATPVPRSGTIDMKLEVVVMPVSDIDRAKRFYEGLGWRLDADLTSGDGGRVVQLTPPGSPCSIHLRQNSDAGRSSGAWLIVSDVAVARAELIARSANVSEPFHFAAGQGRVSGRDPEGHSYNSFAAFSDPDGNNWLLQEIATRLPGRGLGLDVATMTELLRETEHHHGEYEPTAPKHHWSAWYAAYIVARMQGKTAAEAAQDGALNVEASLRSPD